VAFWWRFGLFGAVLLAAGAAGATPPTPGYPEAVVHWGVQKGETCDDIAKALYGSSKYSFLLQRYNHVACKTGVPLREGTTLVLPETPTTLADAKLRSMNPDVRARPGGGGWSPAASGMQLYSNYNVNTLDQGRADVEFIDRTRVFLAPNTLVVIYGTASQTRVSKSAPAVVEVESGEVKAGLAALRGDTVEVALKGGSHVSAASRDTVVERKGERTTVAVFEGKAGVTSGGKAVQVPKNFGTRFVGVAPPIPPRPLPPPPLWVGGAPESTVLAPGGVATIDMAWTPMPGAIKYRVEVSRDPEFHDLAVREEVPASINAFHVEKLPITAPADEPGKTRRVERYWFSVRAIDKEEYLGIASELRVVRLVETHVDAGTGVIKPAAIEVNPYGVLRFGPAPELEVSLDEGPFTPFTEVIELDLRRHAPRAIRVRPRGGKDAETIPVRYTRVAAAVEAVAGPDRRSLLVRAPLTGFDGIDVKGRVAPTGRARLPGGVRTFALAAGPDGVLTGSLDLGPELLPDRVRVDVVDDRGAVLGTTEYVAPPPAAPLAGAGTGRPPQIGAYAPMWQLSPASDVLWLAPTPPDGAAVSVGMAHARGGWTAQGQVRASGSVGRLGLDASLRSGTTDDVTADGAAWLGARVRLVRLAGSAFEIAPALRAGFPISALGAPARLEPGLALGGVAGRFTWLADLGGRFRLARDSNATGTPSSQGFLLAGATADVVPWLRVHAVVDANLVFPDLGAKHVLAGLGAGVEAGTSIYGGLSLRVSPWTDAGTGPFSAQLALGFRGFP
jgi:hypothetical protein